MSIQQITEQFADGSPIEYRGVSLLSVEGETIRDFRAYYDSAAFLETAVWESGNGSVDA